MAMGKLIFQKISFKIPGCQWEDLFNDFFLKKSSVFDYSDREKKSFMGRAMKNFAIDVHRAYKSSCRYEPQMHDIHADMELYAPDTSKDRFYLGIPRELVEGDIRIPAFCLSIMGDRRGLDDGLFCEAMETIGYGREMKDRFTLYYAWFMQFGGGRMGYNTIYSSYYRIRGHISSNIIRFEEKPLPDDECIIFGEDGASAFKDIGTRAIL